MTDQEPQQHSQPPSPEAQARSKLWGRLLIVAMGLLVVAYIIPLFRH